VNKESQCSSLRASLFAISWPTPFWFWLISDLLRRHDISGWVKAIWVIGLIVFPYLGIFVYMITQSRGMAERSSQQAQQAREELRRVVGFSAADEIEKLDRLKKGAITDQEFTRLHAKLVHRIRPSFSELCWRCRVGKGAFLRGGNTVERALLPTLRDLGSRPTQRGSGIGVGSTICSRPRRERGSWPRSTGETTELTSQLPV
jgi:hypothetical protein